MKLRRWCLFAAAASVVLAGLLVACGGDGNGEEAESSPEAGRPAAAGETMDVELDDFYFDPDSIEGQAGQTISLELENEGAAAHTFTIDELGIDQVVQPGEKATVELTPSEGGTFTFYCRFHRSQGMEGELTVPGAGGSAAPSGGSSGDNSTGY